MKSTDWFLLFTVAVNVRAAAGILFRRWIVRRLERSLFDVRYADPGRWGAIDEKLDQMIRRSRLVDFLTLGEVFDYLDIRRITKDR